MSEQKDIIINLKLNNKDANASLKTMDSSVDNLNDSITDLTKSIETSFTNMGDTIDDSSDSLKDYNKGLEKTADAQDKVEKSGQKTAGGLKGIASGFGAIMKFTGIVGLLTMLWEMLQKNERIMTMVSKVMTIIGIVFEKVTSAIFDAFDSVSQATGGFDAMKKVITGLLTLAITPLKLAFYEIKAAVLAAQLIWEQSFFGKKDPKKIQDLKDQLKEVKEDVIQVAKDAVEAGKSVANNLGEAMSEVGQLATAVATNVTTAVKGMSLTVIASQADMLVAARKAYAELEIQQKGLDLKYKQQQELQRQIRDNVNLTTEERIAANAELGRLLEEQMGKEQAVLDEKIRIAELELSIDQNSHEKKLALMQLQVVDQAELNERITGMKSEQIANEQALIKEGKDKELADQQEALEKSNDQIKKNQEIINQIYRKSAEDKLAMTRDLQLAELELTTLSEEEKNNAKKEIEANYQADLQEIRDEAAAKEQELKDKKKDEDDKDRQERIDAAKQEAEAVLAIMSQMSNLLGAISDLRFQNELNKMTKSQEQQLKNFKGTEEEKQALIEKFNRDRANLEYRQAKQRKVQSLIDASIGTAVAVATALPNIPLSVLSGLLGLAQIGIIAATPVPPPQYARGGILDGPSHANGGIATPFGEMEGNEGIINARNMANPDLRNLASAANSYGNNGVDFGNGQGINLSSSSIMAIVDGINSKEVVLNTNELSKSNNKVILINNESNI